MQLFTLLTSLTLLISLTFLPTTIYSQIQTIDSHIPLVVDLLTYYLFTSLYAVVKELEVLQTQLLREITC